MDSAAAPAPPHPRNSGPVRPAQVPVTDTSPVRKQRRWAIIALCALLAVIGVLGAMAAVNQAGDRVTVLVVAHDVPAGTKLTAADITTAAVSADPALRPIRATERGSVIGQRTAVDLRQGSLLIRSQLTGAPGIGASDQLVGVQVKRGQVPADALAPGDQVVVVTTPAEGDKLSDTAPPDSIPATVVSVSAPDATGSEVVNLAVSPTDGPTLATRAAVGRVAIVRQPRT